MAYKKCSACKMDPDLCAKASDSNPRKKFIMFTMNLTNRCNQNCTYCFEANRKRQYKDMTKESVDRLFDMIEDKLPEYSPYFSFMGGEPTLKLDLVDYTLQKSVEYSGRHYARIYTNGKMYRDELFVIADKYKNLSIQVSDNYSAFIPYQDRYHLYFSFVITEENIDNALDTLTWFKNNGIRRVVINFDIRRSELKNSVAYSTRVYKFIFNLYKFMSDDFLIETAIREPDFNNKFREDILMFDYFPDEKFYATHAVETEPICGLDNFDVNATRRFFDESPCRKCDKVYVCQTRFVPQMLKADMTQEPFEKICIPTYLMGAIIKE